MTVGAVTAGDPGVHAWDRTKIVWHVVFGVLVVVGAALVLVDDAVPGGRAALAVGGLAALAAWYAATGARVLHAGPGPLGAAYAAVACPLMIGLYAVAPPTAVVLFAVFPQLWSLLSTPRAVVASSLAMLGLGAVQLVRSDFDSAATVSVAVTLGLGMPSSILLGLWISQIIDQSHDRARLLTELESTRAALAAVSHRAGVLAERERLARDLHDTLAQGATSVLLQLRAARDAPDPRRQLALAEATTAGNLAEIRSLVAGLTPPDLAARSLLDAVSGVGARLGEELGVPVAVTSTGTPRSLPPAVEIAVLRAAQELLSNVRRHAAASAVTVALDHGAGAVSLLVADDGRGFDPARADGSGLAGLRRRIGDLGGSVSLATAPRSGTRVTVTVPTAPTAPTAPTVPTAPTGQAGP